MAVYGLQHKRARLAGEIERLTSLTTRCQGRIEELRQLLGAAQVRLVVANAEMAFIDQALGLVFRTEPTPVRQALTPKTTKVPHGSIIRGCFRLLRETPVPLTTNQIAAKLAEQLNLDVSSRKVWMSYRNSVRNCLRREALKGNVYRLHETKTGGMGSWVLVRAEI